jgi:hypothetical protein
MPGLPMRDPHQELVRARDRFNDALGAADVPDPVRIGIRAACDAVAKARAVVAVAELTAHRKLPNANPGSN